jgi:hypothetical protein
MILNLQSNFSFLLLPMLLAAALPSLARADSWNPDQTFAKGTKVISVEGGMGHFGDRLPGGLQEWNVAARFSLLPADVFHFHGAATVFDGAFEIGLEPVFERFNTKRENFGGLSLALRYYLTRLRLGRAIPWVAGSIGPGGSDLRIGTVNTDDRLDGPFMARLTGEAGLAYFVDDDKAVYAGVQATHFSNGGFVHGFDHDHGLNTLAAGIIGFSWYLH